MKTKLPKTCFATRTPDDSFGVVRLRNPVIIAEFRQLNEGGMIATIKPFIWPPDVFAQTTENKFHSILTAMWRFFEEETDCMADLQMYEIAIDYQPPRWLVLDNDESDFTGVLDTERGILWSVGENIAELTAILDWQMHPAHPPKMEFPAATREADVFWREYNRQQKELAAEEDFGPDDPDWQEIEDGDT